MVYFHQSQNRDRGWLAWEKLYEMLVSPLSVGTSSEFLLLISFLIRVPCPENTTRDATRRDAWIFFLSHALAR